MEVSKRVEVFLEFLIFGLVLGIIEDLLVFKLASGDPITWKVLGIIFLVALPFAAISELIVDRTEWIEIKR